MSSDELQKLTEWEEEQISRLRKLGQTKQQSSLLLCLQEDSNSNSPDDFAFLLMTTTAGVVRTANNLAKQGLVTIDGWDDNRQLLLTKKGKEFLTQNLERKECHRLSHRASQQK